MYRLVCAASLRGEFRAGAYYANSYEKLQDDVAASAGPLGVHAERVRAGERGLRARAPRPPLACATHLGQPGASAALDPPAAQLSLDSAESVRRGHSPREHRRRPTAAQHNATRQARYRWWWPWRGRWRGHSGYLRPPGGGLLFGYRVESDRDEILKPSV